MSYTYLQPGAARYQGIVEDRVQFTMSHQILNEKTWKDFVEVFRDNSDDEDMGWRCEYWGKMMRGAVLIYLYNGDEGLYRVLENTMRDLMSTPRKDGRISTYSDEKQLTGGWDVWGRKYILTGSLHFYRICRDEELKLQILEMLQNHLDALIAIVGKEEEGKRCIFDTSNHWLGVNSCSILETVIDLYKITSCEKYLEFAQYLIGTGGCSGGDLIELALAGEKMPYEYPEVKAYETMSFFEGVLAYGQLTGQQKYIDAAMKFMEAVYESDITVIGCSGCTHELFDHSAVKQVQPSDGIMQETCVTVTWMRILAILYQNTGDPKYMERLERSMYNAMYGSVNTDMQEMFAMEQKMYMPPVAFDSYSPLYNGRRGLGIGGFKIFKFGGYYGCCACIASAGIALAALCSTMQSSEGIAINMIVPGKVAWDKGKGKKLVLQTRTELPLQAEACWTVTEAGSEPCSIAIRMADYLENSCWTLNGEKVQPEKEKGYAIWKRVWKQGDVLTLKAGLSVREEKREEKTALTYGPYVLCRDSEKEKENIDLTEKIVLQYPLDYAVEERGRGEEIRLRFKRADGKEDLILTDYQSCGKKWNSEKNRVTVWFNLN